MYEDLLRSLDGTLRSLSMATVLVHCDQRYVGLIGQQKDDSLKSMGEDTSNVRHRIRYFDAYWSHQREQYHWYLMGYIPRSLYQYWLICRRRDWQIGEIVTKVLDQEREFVTNLNKLAEMQKEQEAALSEQILYRNGWERAKNYIPDESFVSMMDKVMKESSDKYIHEMLDARLVRDPD